MTSKVQTLTHDTEIVSVGRAHVHLRLDQRLPLLDQRAQLVASQVHSVEVRQHRRALNILTTKLDFPVSLLEENHLKGGGQGVRMSGKVKL